MAVDVGGIEQLDTGRHCGGDHGRGVGDIRRRQPHAPEADHVTAYAVFAGKRALKGYSLAPWREPCSNQTAMWKNLVLVCVLATGCKNAGVDEVAKKDDTSAESADQPGAAMRSGKIDLGTRRNRPAALEDGNAAAPAGEEIQDRRRARIAQFDTDGDGKINQEERKLARHKRAEDMRKQADADNNGKVTADEIAKSNFKRLDPESLDTNKDGDISADEIEAALESRTKAWGGGRFRDGKFMPRPSKRDGSAAGSAAKP